MLQSTGWLNVGEKCRVCGSILVGDTFRSTVQQRVFRINHHFDCNSQGVIYLITCGKCSKQYVGSTITTFCLRFNNHKSSINWFSKGQRGLSGQHLYEHFFEEGHSGLNDFRAQIIDVTDVNKPTERESFWIEKLNTYVPLGLNLREEY